MVESCGQLNERLVQIHSECIEGAADQVNKTENQTTAAIVITFLADL